MELEANERIRGNLRDVNLTGRFGVQVIAIKRGGKVEISPRAEEELRAHDKLVVIGLAHAIDDLRRYLGG